ncbi:hypothetical protein [Thermogemmatispora tikiterensis]|nr:hypothetical protein [Thermogemmatispora tikiterensis]
MSTISTSGLLRGKTVSESDAAVGCLGSVMEQGFPWSGGAA